MKNRRTFKGQRNMLALNWTTGVLLLVLCVSLTGCDGHFLSLDCIGSSGFCGPVAPTPNVPALVAASNAITATTPLVVDPLSKQDKYQWGVNNICYFQNKAYYVKRKGGSSGTYTCDSTKLSYQNVAIAMDVTLLSGGSADSAGIIFRATPDIDTFYDFMINSGIFLLGSFYNNNVIVIIPPTASSAIHGFGKTNRLLVIADEADFKLFINGTFVGEVHDHTITAAGSVGVALSYDSKGAEASFANLAIYHA